LAFSEVNEKSRLIDGKNYEKFYYFYAKQTQFTNCPIEHNYLYNNDICNFYQSDKSQKQSQNKPNSKPIQTQFPKGQKMNVRNAITMNYKDFIPLTGAQKQSQNKPNSKPI